MTHIPTIVAAITDLMLQSRLLEQARALGYQVRVADTPDAVRDALAAGPALLVVDLQAQGLDWRDAVALAKERDARVLAYGQHTQAALLRAAREAGCDRVVARSTFVEELPQLLYELAGAPPPAPE
jgi:CheY-like chemotaxis protein